MIVRERKSEFLMIEQDRHGRLARDIMAHWKEDLFPGLEWRDKVLLAVENHDIGWFPFDRQPFWNEAKSAPYRFTDFPLLPKLVLYKQGIDRVEEMDGYAAMLCSHHYEQFVMSSEEEEARDFIRAEKQRRNGLAKQISGFDPDLFSQHYGLLQLGDNFSLYCCVNEPGSEKSDEHPFFRNGIPSPDVLPGLPGGKLAIRFSGKRTVKVEDFPFSGTFSVDIPQRAVSKEAILQNGLLSAYNASKEELLTLSFSTE